MATLKEIVYDIKNIVRGGMQSDDEIISDRQIEFQIHSLRAQFIRQDINKRRSISDNIKQIITCLKVEAVKGSTCGLSDDIIIVRSKEKVPNPIETSHSDLITAIGPTGILSVKLGTLKVEDPSPVPYVVPITANKAEYVLLDTAAPSQFR